MASYKLAPRLLGQSRVFGGRLSCINSGIHEHNVRTMSRSNSAAYAGDGKTTVQVINKNDSPLHLINTYSAKGFRLNNNLFITGSVLVFPTNVFCWTVRKSKDITLDSLILFDLIVPKVKIVVIGYGSLGDEVDSSLPMKLKKKGISCELLPTPNAVTTYNYLVNDSVHAAGAFIPVSEEVTMTEADRQALGGYDMVATDIDYIREETPKTRMKFGMEKQLHEAVNKPDNKNKKTFDE